GGVFGGQAGGGGGSGEGRRKLQSRSSQVPRATGCTRGRGGRRQTGCSLQKSRTGRACGKPTGICYGLRSRRVAQLRGFAKKRRRHNLFYDDRFGRHRL